MASPLEKLLRAGEGRVIKRLQGVAKSVNALEDEYAASEREHLFGEKFNALVDQAFDSPGSLDPAAKALEVPVGKTELFDRDAGTGIAANPKVREVVESELGGLARVNLIDPLDYEPFANLLARSYLVLTDSGGIQEEAPALGKPVLVLRDTTERPEAIDAGTVKLIGTDIARIYNEAKLLIADKDEYEKMANACNPYGDGQAARRIVQAILWKHGLIADKPDSFEF